MSSPRVLVLRAGRGGSRSLPNSRASQPMAGMEGTKDSRIAPAGGAQLLAQPRGHIPHGIDALGHPVGNIQPEMLLKADNELYGIESHKRTYAR